MHVRRSKAWRRMYSSTVDTEHQSVEAKTPPLEQPQLRYSSYAQADECITRSRTASTVLMPSQELTPHLLLSHRFTGGTCIRNTLLCGQRRLILGQHISILTNAPTEQRTRLAHTCRRSCTLYDG